MKKLLTTVLLIFALLTMVGCSASNGAPQLDIAENKMEHALDAAEDRLKNAVRKAVVPAATEAAQAVTEPVPAATETRQAASEPLTKEGAEDIALKYAGLARDQVKRLHTEYEIDDGISQYDVEFRQGDWEYEFEIHAETGKILSFDKDHKND